MVAGLRGRNVLGRGAESAAQHGGSDPPTAVNLARANPRHQPARRRPIHPPARIGGGRGRVELVIVLFVNPQFTQGQDDGARMSRQFRGGVDQADARPGRIGMQRRSADGCRRRIVAQARAAGEEADDDREILDGLKHRVNSTSRVRGRDDATTLIIRLRPAFCKRFFFTSARIGVIGGQISFLLTWQSSWNPRSLGGRQGALRLECVVRRTRTPWTS